MRTITYKGFQASVEFDAGALFVRVLHIDDLLVAQVDKASDAEAALAELVDAYIADCKEIGKEPQKTFSGSLNVRIGPDLHKGAALAAAERGATLNAWIAEAISDKVQCDSLARRMSGVVKDAQKDLQLLQMAPARVLRLEQVGGFAAMSVREVLSIGTDEAEWSKYDG